MVDIEKYSVEQLLQGYIFDTENAEYICIECGQSFAKGEIFCIENRFFDAEKAVKKHIDTHTNRFCDMLCSNERYLSLTENQKELLNCINSGLNDGEIAKKLKISPTTVRNQRFVFREKAKSAKLYLAVWSMAEKNAKRCRQSELINLNGGENMLDERFVITQEENDKISKTVFESLEPLRLKLFPVKEKKKIVILRTIIQKFEKNKKYTEKQVNAILQDIYPDYVTIRRYLIEYGYMDRTTNCNEYWVK